MIAVPDGTIRFASGVNRFDVLSAGDAARRGTDGGAVPPTSTCGTTRDPAQLKRARPGRGACASYSLCAPQSTTRSGGARGAAGVCVRTQGGSYVRSYL